MPFYVADTETVSLKVISVTTTLNSYSLLRSKDWLEVVQPLLKQDPDSQRPIIRCRKKMYFTNFKSCDKLISN